MAISSGTEDLSMGKDQFRDPAWGAQQLGAISLFEYMSEQELFELYQLGQINLIQPKANVVIEGEQSRGLYLLLEGTVSIYKSDRANGNMIRLAYLESGSAFGELSLFDNSPRSATVVGESICYVFYLDETPFTKFLDDKGNDIKVRFYKKCAEDMVSRFRVQNSDYIIAQTLLWKYALRKEEKDEKEGSKKESS